MKQLITEHNDLLLARLEAPDRVFEVSIETIEPTDVTLRLNRDGERVGSIYNDDGTERTMARLTTAREGSDFISVAVPKAFVNSLLDTAIDSDRVTDLEKAAGYRLRVLSDVEDTEP